MSIKKNGSVEVSNFYSDSLVYSADRLPIEYQEIEYIESNGYDYIDCNWSETSDCNIDCKFYNPSLIYNYLFGSMQSSAAAGPHGPMMFNGLYYRDRLEYNWGVVSCIYSGFIEMKQEISGSNIIIILNGVATTVPKGTDANGKNFYIFACNGGNRKYRAKLRCYYFKIRDGSTLIRDFVPCYRKSDNKPGLYDLVSQTFFTNANTSSTTDFSIPPERMTRIQSELLKNYTRVEYLVGGQGQYIDTNCPVEENKDFSIKFKSWFSKSGSRGCILGFLENASVQTTFEFINYFRVYNKTQDFYVYSVGDACEVIINGEAMFDSTNKQIAGISNIKMVSRDCAFLMTGNTSPYIFVDRSKKFSTFNKEHRLYYLEMYLDGIMVRNFIPVIRNSDSKPGLFDTVTRTFFTNAGTGEFTYGPTVTNTNKILIANDFYED